MLHAILPVKLLNFDDEGEQNGKRVFKLKVDEASTVNNIVLEKSDKDFSPVATLFGSFQKNEMIINGDISSDNTYRLKLTNQLGVVSYSKEIKIPVQNNAVVSWPDPVKDKIFVRIKTVGKGKLSFTIVNTNGAIVKAADIVADQGDQTVSIPLMNFDKGIYYFRMHGQPLQQEIFFRFIK